ncbi:MAG: hypothetical protein R3266_12665, partial [Gemmatimonadota bacterium]|nr:hypothetical protein [Gemmatimonadota bacterium]
RFWRNDFRSLSAGRFYFYWGFAFVASFAFILRGSAELGDVLLYKVGFIDNFINSALFIVMLHRRPGLEGQTIYIGIAKMLGTGSMAIAWLLHPWPGTEDSGILVPLYLGIAVLDLAYVVEVYRKARRLGIDPWRRW